MVAALDAVPAGAMVVHMNAVGPREAACQYVYPPKGPPPKDQNIRIAFALGIAARHNEMLPQDERVNLQGRACEFFARLEKAFRFRCPNVEKAEETVIFLLHLTTDTKLQMSEPWTD